MKKRETKMKYIVCSYYDDLINDKDFCNLIHADVEDILWSNNYAIFNEDMTSIDFIEIDIQLDNPNYNEDFDIDLTKEEGHKVFEQFQKTKGFDKAVEEAKETLQEYKEDLEI